ncbi:hypothetical protein WP50_00730 [Lactiplantibacillus plantarum]|nr:hypothetical protein WP50_00730 [Lactiplantibacillus plantarum]
MFAYYGMFLWLPSVLVLRGFSLVHGFGYTMLMSLAQLPGYYLAAWLIGVVKRKPVLIGTLLLFSLGNLLLTITPNVEWFLVVRLLTGIGLGGELPVAATMIADHYTGTQRSRMLVLVDSFWAFGWIAASLLAFFNNCFFYFPDIRFDIAMSGGH